MASYRRSHQYRSHKKRNIGYERALEHIKCANELSEELGGTDEDVKKYFFSLSGTQLHEILNEYGRLYGNSAREYADITLEKWKSGRVHMSGMVAERLFNLLPPIMPLDVKYKLTETLWEHVGPSSLKIYYFGLDVDLDEITNCIKQYLEEIVSQHNIPENMESRFNWLSHGDVDVKQKLLNHFRQEEKKLLTIAIENDLPILIDHLKSVQGQSTSKATKELNVGKHVIRVIFNDSVQGFAEIEPSIQVQKSSLSWIWWLLGIGFIIWLMNN